MGIYLFGCMKEHESKLIGHGRMSTEYRYCLTLKQCEENRICCLNMNECECNVYCFDHTNITTKCERT